MTDTIESEKPFDVWAVVEVMGHRFHAGKISEQTIAGTGFLKVEALTVMGEDGEVWETVFYQPHALFSIRPGSEDAVRREAPRSYPSRLAGALTPGRYPVDEDLDDEDGGF